MPPQVPKGHPRIPKSGPKGLPENPKLFSKVIRAPPKGSQALHGGTKIRLRLPKISPKGPRSLLSRLKQLIFSQLYAEMSFGSCVDAPPPPNSKDPKCSTLSPVSLSPSPTEPPLTNDAFCLALLYFALFCFALRCLTLFCSAVLCFTTFALLRQALL